jgi:hypothetical protein
MAGPSHLPRLDYSNYTWRRVQITKLLIMQFSPFCRHSTRTVHGNIHANGAHKSNDIPKQRLTGPQSKHGGREVAQVRVKGEFQ